MFFPEDKDAFNAAIKEYLPASVATTKDKLWPFIEQAERKYIAPLLEEELYNELLDHYNNSGTGSGSGWDSGDESETADKLIKLIQLAEINLAYMIGFSTLNVKISDGAFQRLETEKFKSLYKYQEEDLRKYFESTGFNTLDDILKYMEDNIEVFPEWEDSANYTVLKKAIIQDTRTYDSIVFINSSRLIFLRLGRYMQQVIDFSIVPLLGSELWASFLAEMAKDSPDAKYTALKPYLQKPLAFLAAAELIENTGSLTDRGLYFEGKNSGSPDNNFKRAATSVQIDVAGRNYRVTGDKYLELLRQHLANNDYTEYSGQTGTVYDRDNTDKKVFVT